MRFAMLTELLQLKTIFQCLFVFRTEIVDLPTLCAFKLDQCILRHIREDYELKIVFKYLSGADGGTRTHDLRITSALLYH